jgi:pyridoxal phosphate enzyme (YggS family)
MASLDTTTQARLAEVRGRIERAARAAGRDPQQVTLVAISKTFGADRIREALAAGQHRFGENYLQEAVEKIDQVSRNPVLNTGLQPVEWHFVGPIQSNKTRELADRFDWVQSVDRLKVAQRLSQQRPADRPPLNVLLQINVSGEATKHGVPPDEAPEMARQIVALPRLRLRGLMAIPEATSEPLRQRTSFARLRTLLEQLRGGMAQDGPDLDTLSMGMSDDLEAAVAEGSTMVRVGTAIFGARK